MSIFDTSKDYSILYVDDEEKTLKYFSRFFSKDYNILTAQNTTEARAILDQHAGEIGVLISDQRMPVEKGVELLKYSREKYPHIIRLLTTAYSDLGDAIEAVNRGEILRYIPKPWDINFLELEIRHAMRFFLLNIEREQLRKEKLSVIQRVTGINKAKDLIILASGLTHIRQPLHAIQSLLQQLPYTSMDASANYKTNDAWGLVKSEVSEVMILADQILKDTRSDSNFVFETVDIAGKVSEFSASEPVKAKLHIDTDVKTIEAVPLLIDNLFRLLLEKSPAHGDSGIDNVNIYVSNGNNNLEIKITPNPDKEIFTIWNIPARLLSIFLICYHHGGNIQIDDDIVIRLPLTQDVAKLPELEPQWQEQIFERFEVLPE